MPWKKIGSVLKGKNGNYIKIDLGMKDGKPVGGEITLKSGQRLEVFDPRKSKFITEEKLAKIPDFVKAEIFIAPEDETKA